MRDVVVFILQTCCHIRYLPACNQTVQVYLRVKWLENERLLSLDCVVRLIHGSGSENKNISKKPPSNVTIYC